MDKKVLFLTQSAIIAGLYVMLLLAFQPISVSAIQFRISEALTILPYFTPAAIPGLFVGCFLGNLLAGCAPLDFIFGSLTTLVAAALSYGLRKHKFLVPLPPILLNALVIPFVLLKAYGTEEGIPFMMATVGAGQVIACGVLGMILLMALDRHKHTIFGNYVYHKK